MNNYLNFNTHKQVAFEYRNASKGFIGDTSKMLAPAGAVVGGVGGCAVGGAIGAIGGALTGAATFC